MEIYLCWDNDEKKILLPINPTSFEIAVTKDDTRVEIPNLGEIILKGKRGLYGITLKSFFPAQKYSFQHGKFYDPYKYYVKRIRKLVEKNTTVHLIMTETDINMYCLIDGFTYGEADGTGDVEYEIPLTEYRMDDAVKRISTKKKQAVYTWKKGDTWPKVVKKHTGSSSTWKKIRTANQTVISKAKKKAPNKKETDALIGYKVVIK